MLFGSREDLLDADEVGDFLKKLAQAKTFEDLLLIADSKRHLISLLR